MVKILTLRLERCNQCPKFQDRQESYGRTMAIRPMCLMTNLYHADKPQPLHARYTIPKWCPLPDEGDKIMAKKCATPTCQTPDREGLIDELDYVLSESLDVDWTTRVGAERVADYILDSVLKQLK